MLRKPECEFELVNPKCVARLWRFSPLPSQGRGRGEDFSPRSPPSQETPHLNPLPFAKGDRQTIAATHVSESLRRQQIFPDSKCRVDRKFVSAYNADHARRHWSPLATSVFLRGQCRARPFSRRPTLAP